MSKIGNYRVGVADAIEREHHAPSKAEGGR
jgi:hypothetical protein